MKKPIIFTVFFFTLTATPSFGQGVWIDENVDLGTGLRTGKIEVNGNIYEIKPNATSIKPTSKEPTSGKPTSSKPTESCWLMR